VLAQERWRAQKILLVIRVGTVAQNGCAGQIPCKFPANSLPGRENPLSMRVCGETFFSTGKFPCEIPCAGNFGLQTSLWNFLSSGRTGRLILLPLSGARLVRQSG